MTTSTDHTLRATDGPIHKHFSLDYCNYLVLNRTHLQSMPIEFQERFVACLDEFDAAFEHVPRAENFEVHAATDHEICDLTDEQRAALGITTHWYDADEPTDLSEDDLAEWRAAHELPAAPVYRDADGSDVSWDDRVLVRCEDPVPHYNRGRTYVEPRIGGAR